MELTDGFLGPDEEIVDVVSRSRRANDCQQPIVGLVGPMSTPAKWAEDDRLTLIAQTRAESAAGGVHAHGVSQDGDHVNRTSRARRLLPRIATQWAVVLSNVLMTGKRSHDEVAR
jgi:hypothetical protein